MPANLQLQSIHLRVSDLARSTAFYTRQLGFVVGRATADHVDLCADSDSAPFLTISAVPAAPRPAADAAGLFHCALLFPSRARLGRWLTLAAANQVPLAGFADHGVSEAIYFSDPDGNGLEFYADRAPVEWPRANGELAMTTRPLALPSLLAAAAPVSEHPLAGSRWGHLHLRVTDLERSETFYRRELGLDVTQRSFPGARFLAADGYHHHLGLNSWGHPRRPQSPAATGLVEATFTRDGRPAEQVLTDPDGIVVRLIAR